jgi:glycosyltransferase involved in cell wall biosynthesis
VAVETARRGLIAPGRIRAIGVAVGGDDGTEPGPDRAPGTGLATPEPGPDRAPVAGLAVPGTGLVLPARDPAACQRARRALGLPADAIVIGAVGRLTYQKAPEDFVKMLRLLRRPGLAGVWIGDGELAGGGAAAGGRRPRGPARPAQRTRRRSGPAARL